MTEHTLKLATEPFNAIASGNKTVESRLFDEKRKFIQLGDYIIFVNRDDPSENIKVKVVGLLKYANFATMFNKNDPKKFGGPDAKWLLNQIEEFYTEEDQNTYGVIGIEFELL